jgi:hypothetical protein
VLVDVSELSTEERALILFRHARSVGLGTSARQLVRQHAGDIVNDAEFTPERMRRFVHDSLPRLTLELETNDLKVDRIKVAIKEALRNPTKQMRVAFQKLLPAYKWPLVAFLGVSEISTTYLMEAEGNVTKLKRLYEAYCPEKYHEPFNTVMEHLTEAFVKARRNYWQKTMVDWIHPSYRDLVIDELIQDSSLRNTFLRRASLEGVKLAVSDTGGQCGERRLPLIRSAESWDILEERCLSLSNGRRR